MRQCPTEGGEKHMEKIKRLIPPFKLGPNRTVWSRDALELWKKSRKNDIPDWAK